MADVSGEVVEVGTRDALFDPVNSTIVIKSGRKIVASGTVDRDNRFSIEIPDGLEGQLELVTSITGAAPVLFDAGDAELVVMVGRGGSNMFA